MPHILVLEDDDDIRLGVEQHFLREGFTVSSFSKGKDVLRHLTQVGMGQAPKPEAALLDLTLPDMDGLEVLRAIRADPQHRTLPVVLVTARNEEIDRILGLEMGADDYVSKPFSSRELVARLRAILRRASFMEDQASGQMLAFGGLSVDLDAHVARVEGAAVELTRREFELLAYFLKNPKRVLGREKILQQVWGLEYLGESRTIDAHVRRLRSKLGAAANCIETVVGVGYRLGNSAGGA